MENQPEEWRPVLGYEGLYEVSNLGRVKSLERKVNTSIRHSKTRTIRERILKAVLYVGYPAVQLWREGKSRIGLIHRLVAQSFIENPDQKPFVNHLDGNRTNHSIANLEWCTPKENRQHAVETGLLNPYFERKFSSQALENIRSKNSRPIAIMFPDGSEKHYRSGADACRELGITKSKLDNLLINERRMIKGYAAYRLAPNKTSR